MTGRPDVATVVGMTGTRFNTMSLAALALVLAAAFVLLPRPFAQAMTGRGYGDERDLRAKATTAFLDYWHTGKRALTAEFSQLVDYWRWYHLLKSAAAIGLMIVLVVLAVRLWKGYARSGTNAEAWPRTTGGVVVTVLAVVAVVAAMANVQGTLAPFSSLMSMLPINSAQGDLLVMIGQVKAELGHYSSDSPGALTQMVNDLAGYHVVLAVIAGGLAAVLVAAVIASFRAYAGTPTIDRRPRRLFRWLGVAALFMSVLMLVLALGNTSTAIDSPTAVLNFYKGTI